MSAKNRSLLRRLGVALLALGLVFAVAACADDDDVDLGEPEVGEDPVDEPAEDPADEPDEEATGEPETTSMRLGIMPIAALSQVFVADARGYFEDEGLDIELVPMAGGAEIAAAVEGGDLQIGQSNVLSIALAYASDFDFQFFVGGIYQSPGHYHQALLVPADSDLESPADLEGAQVAVNQLSNINDIMIRQYVAEHGMDTDSITPVELDFPDMIPALTEGRVDAAVSTEPFGTIGENSGATRMLDPNPFTTVFGDEVFIAGYFAPGAWLAENPNTVAALRRAWQRATDDIHADGAAAREVLPDYTPMPPEIAQQITQPEFRMEIQPEDIQVWVDLAVEQGVMAEQIDVSGLLYR